MLRVVASFVFGLSGAVTLTQHEEVDVLRYECQEKWAEDEEHMQLGYSTANADEVTWRVGEREVDEADVLPSAQPRYKASEMWG